MEENGRNSVLVVDDEKINLDVLRNILSPEYNVHMAKRGSSALEIANRYEPDLILLDIIMPDMNGFAVLETLKSSLKTSRIPVIIITGLESVEDEEKCLALEAADFIHKPFSNKIVISKVRHQIQIVNQIRAIEQYTHNLHLALGKLEAIVNNYKGLIWSVDNDSVITSFSGQYLEKLGILSSFLVGKNIQIARNKNRHLDIIDNIEKTFREGSQDWQSDVDGYIFRSHTTLLHDNEGKTEGIVGSSDDVTELIKLQRDLKAAVEAAEKANQTKSAFLAKMSHEIRTPLNAVLGISEIQLQNETLQNDVKEAFTRIYNSGDILLGIINDILDMSKIEAGKLEISEAQYDVSDMINDAVFLNLIKYESKPIRFILNVDENVPSRLLGDDLRIKQIINNLLSNAFKYTASGEVEMSINTEFNTDSVVLVLRVRDTGQGMTNDQIDRLFDNYSRFNLESNRTTEGTGLGMGITQNLINMMNGEITLESEAGKGSIFTIRLPQGSVGAAALGKDAAKKISQFSLNNETKLKKMQITREPIPSGKVLVVDDMEMNLYVAKGMLSPYWLQIDTASSGPEAIEKIKNGAYDLIFMDHMMPIMDGLEAASLIRKLGPEYEKLPIIALTANAVSGVKEMFLNAGFNGFISKPIAAPELDEVLKTWLSSEKMAKRVDKETTNTDKTKERFFIEAAKIKEIEVESGLENVNGDIERYRSTIEIFYKDIVSECEKMKDFLDNNDIKNFTVSIHAMKSKLEIIGAISLSKSALEMETESKNRKIDHCKKIFPQFMENLLSLHRKLSLVLSKSKEKTEIEDRQKKPISEKSEKGNILVVDDMDMLLFVIKEKLTSYGFHVDTASSGHEAIQKTKDGQYDLVFMDHMMPDMDGIEAAAEIRKLKPEYDNLPIIALTANEEQGLEEMFLSSGLNGYLSKPVKTDNLVKILKQWLPLT